MRSATLHIRGGDRLGKVWLARGMWERMKGLLGRQTLPEKEFMLLEPCSSIHTFGMKFAIDVIFLDRDWRVVKTCAEIPPRRVVAGGLRARRTLEAASGWLDLTALAGVQLQVSEED